jgi:altronate dehydratase
VASTLPRVLLLNRRDNVAVAIRALRAGDQVELDGRQVDVAEDIPFGHKLAVAEIGAGDSVVKYGEVIGRATAAIAPGRHVHVHNVVSARLPGSS